MGDIYEGVFAPTEAGAAGAVISMIVALLKGEINAKTFQHIW
ncbi:MAG: hypothetical protein ACR2Q4_00545 [Geminicoccaceae bacterium]